MPASSLTTFASKLAPTLSATDTRAGVYSVVIQVDDRADRLGLDLRGIVTRLLDLVQVRLVDIASDVLAVEHRAIELLDLDLATANGFDQVRQVLIDQPIGADQVCNVLG